MDGPLSASLDEDRQHSERGGRHGHCETAKRRAAQQQEGGRRDAVETHDRESFGARAPHSEGEVPSRQATVPPPIAARAARDFGLPSSIP